VKIFHSIVTICAAHLVLFVVLNIAAGYEVFSFVPWLQILPSFDLMMWLLAALLLVSSVLLGGEWLLPLGAFFLISFLLIIRHHSQTIHLESEIPATDTLKIVSLNVGQFSNDTAVVVQCIKLIQEEKPDAVCLQEFGLYFKWPDVYSVAADFAKRAGYLYFDFTPKRGNIFGTAFFSNHEITTIDTVFQLLSHTNETKIYSLNVHGKHVSIANVHLQSYNLFSSRDALTFGSVMNAIEMRNEQVHWLVDAQPNIIVGDLNASPGTIVHSRLCDDYVDVQLNFGNPFSPTHQVFPTRLDYVFVVENFKPISFRLSAKSPSDHKMLVAEILF